MSFSVPNGHATIESSRNARPRSAASSGTRSRPAGTTFGSTEPEAPVSELLTAPRLALRRLEREPEDLRGDLDAGPVHALGRDLGVVHDDLDREAVDQRGDPERELVGILGRGELSRGLAAPDDLGELSPPPP